MDEFDLFPLMDTKIIDQVISKLWNGQDVEINCSIMDFSTSYCMLMDKSKIFTTDKLYGVI